MTHGDVEQRLRDLQAADLQFLDHTSRKIRACANLSFAETVSACTLLSDVAASTALVEKTHRHGAMLRQYHSRVSPSMLSWRCFLADAKILYTPSKQDVSIRSLQQKIDAPDGRIYFTAQNAFCRYLLATTSAGSQNGSQFKAIASTHQASNILFNDKTWGGDKKLIIKISQFRYFESQHILINGPSSHK